MNTEVESESKRKGPTITSASTSVDAALHQLNEGQKLRLAFASSYFPPLSSSPDGTSTSTNTATATATATRMMLSGDVMLGRGVDMLRPTHCKPVIYESYMKNAERYVSLAEREQGKRFSRLVGPGYVWGELLEDIHSADLRLINLETTVTTHKEPYPDKGINYRMHPKNIDALQTAKIECCVLANNHVLDWRIPGLLETLHTLKAANISTAGAGQDSEEATSPACLKASNGRDVLVFGLGSITSGVPPDWAATDSRPGLAYHNPDSHDEKVVAEDIKKLVRRQLGKMSLKDRPIVVVSIHWGPNWGYGVDKWQRRLARALVQIAGVDVVYGHSSHHPMGIELIDGKLVLYGCGDLLNDYEGITGQGHEIYRPELALLYFPTIGKDVANLSRFK